MHTLCGCLCIHGFMHALWIPTRMHTYANIQTYMQAYLLPYMSTYICNIYMYIVPPLSRSVPSPWWAPQPGTASLLNFAFLTEPLHLLFSHLKTALFDRAGVGSAS